VSYLNKPVEDDELLSIVDLYLSPWGNAKIRGNDTFVCQVLLKKTFELLLH
jgi:interferon gamma-inducible protein 30